VKRVISAMMRLLDRRSCEDVVAVLHDYFEGTLDSRVAKTIEKHFRDCPDCEAFSETYATLIQLTGELACEDIPDEVRRRVHLALEERSVLKIR
jgi:predicted anti-sigma-YlaC factor YlaD